MWYGNCILERISAYIFPKIFFFRYCHGGWLWKEALDLGAKGFLVKPYDIQELLDMVRLVADGRSSQNLPASGGQSR